MVKKRNQHQASPQQIALRRNRGKKASGTITESSSTSTSGSIQALVSYFSAENREKRAIKRRENAQRRKVEGRVEKSEKLDKKITFAEATSMDDGEWKEWVRVAEEEQAIKQREEKQKRAIESRVTQAKKLGRTLTFEQARDMDSDQWKEWVAKTKQENKKKQQAEDAEKRKKQKEYDDALLVVKAIAGRTEVPDRLMDGLIEVIRKGLAYGSSGKLAKHLIKAALKCEGEQRAKLAALFIVDVHSLILHEERGALLRKHREKIEELVGMELQNGEAKQVFARVDSRRGYIEGEIARYRRGEPVTLEEVYDVLITFAYRPLVMTGGKKKKKKVKNRKLRAKAQTLAKKLGKKGITDASEVVKQLETVRTWDYGTVKYLLRAAATGTEGVKSHALALFLRGWSKLDLTDRTKLVQKSSLRIFGGERGNFERAFGEAVPVDEVEEKTLEVLAKRKHYDVQFWSDAFENSSRLGRAVAVLFEQEGLAWQLLIKNIRSVGKHIEAYDAKKCNGEHSERYKRFIDQAVEALDTGAAISLLKYRGLEQLSDELFDKVVSQVSNPEYTRDCLHLMKRKRRVPSSTVMDLINIVEGESAERAVLALNVLCASDVQDDRVTTCLWGQLVKPKHPDLRTTALIHVADVAPELVHDGDVKGELVDIIEDPDNFDREQALGAAYKLSQIGDSTFHLELGRTVADALDEARKKLQDDGEVYHESSWYTIATLYEAGMPEAQQLFYEEVLPKVVTVVVSSDFGEEETQEAIYLLGEFRKEFTSWAQSQDNVDKVDEYVRAVLREKKHIPKARRSDVEKAVEFAATCTDEHVEDALSALAGKYATQTSGNRVVILGGIPELKKYGYCDTLAIKDGKLEGADAEQVRRFRVLREMAEIDQREFRQTGRMDERLSGIYDVLREETRQVFDDHTESQEESVVGLRKEIVELLAIIELENSEFWVKACADAQCGIRAIDALERRLESSETCADALLTCVELERPSDKMLEVAFAALSNPLAARAAALMVIKSKELVGARACALLEGDDATFTAAVSKLDTIPLSLEEKEQASSKIAERLMIPDLSTDERRALFQQSLVRLCTFEQEGIEAAEQATSELSEIAVAILQGNISDDLQERERQEQWAVSILLGFMNHDVEGAEQLVQDHLVPFSVFRTRNGSTFEQTLGREMLTLLANDVHFVGWLRSSDNIDTAARTLAAIEPHCESDLVTLTIQELHGGEVSEERETMFLAADHARQIEQGGTMLFGSHMTEEQEERMVGVVKKLLEEGDNAVFNNIASNLDLLVVDSAGRGELAPALAERAKQRNLETEEDVQTFQNAIGVLANDALQDVEQAKEEVTSLILDAEEELGHSLFGRDSVDAISDAELWACNVLFQFVVYENERAFESIEEVILLAQQQIEHGDEVAQQVGRQLLSQVTQKPLYLNWLANQCLEGSEETREKAITTLLTLSSFDEVGMVQSASEQLLSIAVTQLNEEVETREGYDQQTNAWNLILHFSVHGIDGSQEVVEQRLKPELQTLVEEEDGEIETLIRGVIQTNSNLAPEGVIRTAIREANEQFSADEIVEAYWQVKLRESAEITLAGLTEQ